ncbi:hypothetical protein ACFLS1_07195 [Verrucomicrobiota bacterium]
MNITENVINKGYILPSAAFSLPRNRIGFYKHINKPPAAGDVIYGKITRVGQHSNLENVSGRIHTIHDGTKTLFVFGNRYAPDFFEGIVPEQMITEVDLLARSGLIGIVKAKNSAMKDPTRVKVLGYVCDHEGTVLNTRNFSRIKPKALIKRYPRAKMILICGTSMNSGKSTAASACCWVLTTMGYNVRASKVTGTASLQDILHMNDAGAKIYADFTYLGYPSTYLLPEEDVMNIFNQLDLKYANNPGNFWVVEFADGINQRETAMLLESPEIKSRIHKLVFCATDAFGAVGGLKTLRDRFGLTPDAISGICSSSPLHVRELKEVSDVPVFNSAEPDIGILSEILLLSNGKVNIKRNNEINRNNENSRKTKRNPRPAGRRKTVLC